MKTTYTRHSLLVFFSLTTFILNAQTINYSWAKGMGSNGWDYARDIFVDKNGNSFITGSFEGTVDFDPGIGTFNLTSGGGRDIFIAKYDTAGALLLATAIGGSSDDQGDEIATDTAGNIYVAGWFQGICDFDPGVATQNATSSGQHDIFFAKYDAFGNYMYSKTMNGGALSDVVYGMAVDDTLQNVYLAGYFQNTVDFDPGAGTQNLTSAGGWDIFVAKYDVNGDYVFANRMGSTSNDLAYSLYLDGANDIYIGGDFQGTVDFDPSGGTQNLISAGANDIFIAKYTGSGNYVYAKNVGGAAADYAFSMYVDSPGNVYFTGRFSGTADFDPGVGTYNLASSGLNDAYFAQYNTSGNLVLAKSMGGTGDDQGSRIACDASGNIVVSGTFQNTIDLDPGVGTQNVSSAGATDIYLAIYNSSGNYLYSGKMGGAADENTLGMRVQQGYIYITGYHNAIADFDPGVGVQNISFAGGTSDFFVARYKTPGCTSVNVSVGNDTSICQGSSTALTTGTAYSSYQWSSGSSSSSINVNLPGTYWVTVTDASGCTGTDSVTVVVNPLPAVTWNNPQTIFCVNGGLSTLSGSSPTGGTYSGTGITGNSFNPAVALAGNHTIVYTYTDVNGCTDTASNVFTVHTLPVISWSDVDTARCLNETPFPLNMASPSGGTYSGTGVTGGNTFDPGLAGVGTHSITYSYTDATTGCTGTITKIFTVQVCTGVKEMLEDKKINIFPNPAKDVFVVTIDDVSISDITGIVMLSSDGKVIKPLINESAKGKINVSVNGFSAGLYQLLITTNDKIYTNRVVIL